MTRVSFWYLFALIILMPSLGLFGSLRHKQTNQANSMDTSLRLLIILLVVAILSIGSFIAFIFLRGKVGL